MHAVKIERVKLLGIVRENKDKHVKEFNEAVEDFKKAFLVVAKENLVLAETGSLTEFAKYKVFPQKPNSYENSYVRAIRMLELSVEDTIEVEEDIFNQLVLDEWNWKASFSASTLNLKNGY